ncbi:MAG: hypothetical protein J1F36_04560 [Clostridiales bacterium]|nr:hypothetical protein [Clostridiales bacterium]
MNRIKMAIKTALKIILVALCFLGVGAILTIIGLAADVDALLWIGLLVLAIGLILIIGAFFAAKDMLNAICPQCQKFMGETNKMVNYSYQCDQYEEQYDGNHHFKGYKYYYTCTIECPHCNSTHTFVFTTNAKNDAQANVNVDKYLTKILKLKNK